MDTWHGNIPLWLSTLITGSGEFIGDRSGDCAAIFNHVIGSEINSEIKVE